MHGREDSDDATDPPVPPNGCAQGSDGYGIDLFWVPIRTRGSVVRISSTSYETIDALVARRARCDLYHSALRVRIPGRAVIIEMTRLARDDDERGVIAEGPVALRGAARFGMLRYEVRCWLDGKVRADPAVSPLQLSADATTTRRLLDLAPYVPTLVWGRDELRVGDPWSSNSVVSWLLECSGLDAAHIAPPESGRAPGWCAGISAARRGPLTAPTAPRARLRRTIRLRLSAPRRIAAPIVIEELSPSR
ncbi:MAG TPA: hypothetical protein VND83_04065 [Acidimicrobiales bacterium]|nr:hypothetical protein [Acidimicrobiales bacterium]